MWRCLAVKCVFNRRTLVSVMSFIFGSINTPCKNRREAVCSPDDLAGLKGLSEAVVFFEQLGLKAQMH